MKIDIEDIADIIQRLDMLKDEAKEKNHLGVWIPTTFVDELMNIFKKIVDG